MRIYDLNDDPMLTGEYRLKDVLRWLKETDRDMCGKLSERIVSPYGNAISIGSMIKNYEAFDSCSESSKEVLEDEIVGLIPIVNAEVMNRLDPMIRVRVVCGPNVGEVKNIKKSVAKLFAENGFVEYV